MAGKAGTASLCLIIPPVSVWGPLYDPVAQVESEENETCSPGFFEMKMFLLSFSITILNQELQFPYQKRAGGMAKQSHCGNRSYMSVLAAPEDAEMGHRDLDGSIGQMVLGLMGDPEHFHIPP